MGNVKYIILALFSQFAFAGIVHLDDVDHPSHAIGETAVHCDPNNPRKCLKVTSIGNNEYLTQPIFYNETEAVQEDLQQKNHPMDYEPSKLENEHRKGADRKGADTFYFQ